MLNIKRIKIKNTFIVMDKNYFPQNSNPVDLQPKI